MLYFNSNLGATLDPVQLLSMGIENVRVLGIENVRM